MYAPVTAGLVVLQLFLDHVDHDLVAHKTALVHDLFGLLAQICALGHLITKHIARGKVTDTVVEPFQDLGRLCALAGARRADEDHAHAILPGRTGQLGSSGRCTALQLVDLGLQLRHQSFEVGHLVGRALLRLLADQRYPQKKMDVNILHRSGPTILPCQTYLDRVRRACLLWCLWPL